MFFDSCFTFESKLRWHRLFLTVESTRGIRTLVVVFEFLDEMVAFGYRNDKFNKHFQILPLELKVKFNIHGCGICFLQSPVVFCKLSSKVVSNFSLEKCHDRPSPE